MHARLRDRALEELYRRAVVAREAVPEAVGPYRTLPEPLVTSGFERGTKLNVDLFFDYIRTGRAPSPEDTHELVQIALSRVRDGETLEDVLSRYSVGAEYIWSQLKATATGPERELLNDAAVSLLQYVTLMTTRIATACVQRAHDPRWELLERRRAIADALLTGRDPIEWAEEPAIAVPDAFLVAVFRLGAAKSVDTSELRHRVEAIPGVFLRLDSGGWTALLPLHPGDDGTATVAALSGRLPVHGTRPALGQAAQPGEAPLPKTGPPAPFWVGVAVATARAEVPAIFAEARVLAELGRCLDRPQPVCRRPDLMFEYTVAAGGPARIGLAAVLAPLDSQPLLAETLEVFVDTGFNQLATARLLNIHRNTVTYRLARVHELTGLDPHRPTDAMTLSAARIARRLESASFAP
ncbi:helix-turn-helix domain-containing protein [Nocardia sp. CDC153]|uniref:PucR family transcriptional regulator n=1 Tax=Nocardia sp. CDC153 TaxID=3112167 RepID=UPI002DB8B904|nr:helix-turn-helix domain-containing protein [Nocardia sp. CDC153]MEC3956130.1 helix-turn-helix domain-containing protein [Nocardia sp. CDC153]